MTSFWDIWPWSLPDQVWFFLSGGQEAERQEQRLIADLAHLWLDEGQLRECRRLYRSEVSWLADLTERVYRPLLVEGRSIPLVVVAQVSIGYTLRRVAIPPALDGHASEEFATAMRIWIAQLNRWLGQQPVLDQMREVSLTERIASRGQRATWIGLRTFIERSLSQHAISGNGYPALLPRACDGTALRNALCASENDDGVEQRLLRGLPPKATSEDDEAVTKYLTSAADSIRLRWPPHLTVAGGEEAQVLALAGQRQEASWHYRGRATFSIIQQKTSTPSVANRQVTMGQRKLLDMHALSGFQAYGTFSPDGQLSKALDLLRRRQIDPTVTRRSQESTVDGIARRGAISQLLKWQLALSNDELDVPPGQSNAYLYDRYFNRKLLYLQRVSRQSQELALTLLITLDLSGASHRRLLDGSRIHSVLREVCAHLAQDCYQVLSQVPKLFADLVLVLHDGTNVCWRSSQVIAVDGVPSAGDLFLKPPPLWINPEEEFDDPATFFQFLPQRLLAGQAIANGNEQLPPLEEQIADSVRVARRARLMWLRSSKGRATAAALLPSADLLVSITAVPGPIDHTADHFSFNGFGSLGLAHMPWLCVADEQVELRRLSARSTIDRDYSSLDEFRRLRPGRNPAQQRPAPLRQLFVDSVVRELRSLSNSMEQR